MKVASLSALRTGRFYPRKYSSFLLEADLRMYINWQINVVVKRYYLNLKGHTRISLGLPFHILSFINWSQILQQNFEVSPSTRPGLSASKLLSLHHSWSPLLVRRCISLLLIYEVETTPLNDAISKWLRSKITRITIRGLTLREAWKPLNI
jgi:hypothetical protein